MALGTTRIIKRFYSYFTFNGTVGTDPEDGQRALVEEFNDVVDALLTVETLVNELRTDHATTKVSVDLMDTLIEELAADHAINITWATEVDADLDSINNVLEFEHGLDGVIGGDYTVIGAAAVTLAGAGRIRWRRDGQIFETAMPATVTLGDDGDVDDTKWRAWRLEIADTGAITAVADGDTQHASEEDALLSLASKAKTANTVEIGYWTVNANGAFNIGTDNTNGETAENSYYLREPKQRAAGLTANMGASLAIGSNDDEWSHGTIDAKTQGVAVAQIAAAATVAFGDADIVTTSGNFGGHLFVVDLAGTGVISLAGTGIAGAAQTMDYADLAAANTALDNVQSRLPGIFPVLGRMTNETAKATFTYNTDDGAGTDGTFTFVSETFAAFDRTNQSGTGQGVDQPAIPATVTAPLVATLAATTTITAGPAALTAAAVDLSNVSKLSDIETGDI